MKLFYSDPLVTLYHGSAASLPLDNGTVQTCVTSPPYWGLRAYGTNPQVWGGDSACVHEWGIVANGKDYGSRHGKGDGSTLTGSRTVYSDIPDHDKQEGASCRCGAWRGELGGEPTPEMFVVHLVDVFREVRRVLKNDGTLWLNLGDSYAAHGAGSQGKELAWMGDEIVNRKARTAPPGLKPKDLVGIPWMVAFALRADGWYLRSDIIWVKPNPMPEPVTDRPTKSHEYLFLLAKSERYYYDAEAIQEPAIHAGRVLDYTGSQKANTVHPELQRTLPRGRVITVGDTRNKRSAWTVTSTPYPHAHFATFPPKLIEPCILAGSRPGDIVLDPFNGSGTTGAVSRKHWRRYVGVDLNADYLELSKDRFRQGMLSFDIATA